MHHFGYPVHPTQLNGIAEYQLYMRTMTVLSKFDITTTINGKVT
jgi:hypothetical protein